jgi:hypothetical protein
MAGRQVPVVMFPRYSTLVGATTFTTIAMDVTDYQGAVLGVWRGEIPTDSAFKLTCQESTDQLVWSNCSGTSVVDYDPGQEVEGQSAPTLKKRWFRVQVVLVSNAPSNPFPQVSLWVVGFLEEREQ